MPKSRGNRTQKRALERTRIKETEQQAKRLVVPPHILALSDQLKKPHKPTWT